MNDDLLNKELLKLEEETKGKSNWIKVKPQKTFKWGCVYCGKHLITITEKESDKINYIVCKKCSNKQLKGED